jgi:SNF2 family DNA or RNA helicase
VNSLKWNWMNEVHTHSNEEAYILGYRNGRDGSNADKLADVQDLANNNSYFLITNIESLRDEQIVAALQAACKTGLIKMIAFDECHKAKNPSSEQGKGILKLQADTMIAMTGTPLMNQPFDLFIILKWLGYENHAFYAFKKHYGVFGGYGGYQVVGYQHLDELQENLDKVMLRRRKKDVLDLPEKIYVDEYVEMTGKQEQIYKEVTMDIKSHIDAITMPDNPLAELIRMRQATGFTGILSSTVRESSKLDRMEELVDEAVENGQKVVIFSNWTQMTTPAYERLAKKYHGCVITGETKDAERQKNVEKFQNDDKVKFIIGTIGAMGTGLTLTAGTVEIFLDEPWNRAAKEQAEDRCHRVGTTQNVTIYNLMCKGTIDERIHELVYKKGVMADALVDKQVVTSDKLELLNYLLG